MRVPKPIAIGHTVRDSHFIVLEYLNMTKIDDNGWTRLGRQLAKMHLGNLHNKFSLVLMRNLGVFNK